MRSTSPYSATLSHQAYKPDQIEIRLAYVLHLRDALKLPIRAGQTMLYMAYSQVTKEDLEIVPCVKISSPLLEGEKGTDFYLRELLNRQDFRDMLREEYFGHFEDTSG